MPTTAPENAPRPAWPLFVLAGFAFIPGFGILCGSLAAAWGLLSSRRRALLAAGIGAGGALLQIGIVVAWLLIAGPGSETLSTASRQAAQEDLERLVEALEEYHVRRGAYPASLAELQRSSMATRFINIYDQAGGLFRLPRPYEYHPAADGRSYDLYSAGPDREPATADDIRPELGDSLKARSGYRPEAAGRTGLGIPPPSAGARRAAR